MSKSFRTVVCWTIPTVFMLIYALGPKFGMPQPYYAPMLRQILWDRPEGVLTQGWYGRLLVSLLGSIVLGTLAAWAVSRLPPAWLRYAPWVTAAATVVAMILIAAHEIGRWMI